MKPILLIAFTAVTLLCGCQSLQPTKITPQSNISASLVRPVSLQQQTLWLEGDLQQTTPLAIGSIRANSDRVTLSWDGDAVELLRDLTRARGQTFSYTGVRLPLPVNMHVSGVTYENLLRLIEMQTVWRAALTQYPGQMVLEFMPAIPERRGGRR